MKGNYGKRFLSMMLTVIMVMGMLPVNAFATDDIPDGITIINKCVHHTCSEDVCGYVPAVEGADCTHTHDETCGYAEPVPAKECTCGAAEDAEHAEGCEYAAEIPGTPCNHAHDEACGYVEANEGSPCTFDHASCEICNPAVEEEEPVVECTEHDYVDGFCDICGAEEVYLPCELTEGCELVNGHPGECTGAALYVEAVGGVYEVATKADLKDAIGKAADGETVKLTADIECDEVLAITKAITLDLGGFKLTTTNGWGGLQLKNGCSVKNGYLLHTGRVNAIKVWDVVSIEDLVIEVTDTTEGKTVGGISIQENAAGVDSIKNVTIKGEGLDYGIETYNCGNAQVIGTMENVTIDAVGTGMLLSAPCGTATNCSISGGVTGIDMLLKGTYSVSINLVDCEVYGGEKAVYAHDEQAGYTYEGTLELTVDSATTFDTEEGGELLVTEIADPEDADLSDVEIQVWDGVIDDLAELEWFRDQVNGGEKFEGKTVKLNADINLDGLNWTPIGNDSNYFWGTFDGQDHIISNMTINVNTPDANQFVGLFGGVRKATLKNFKLTNVDIDVVGAKVRAAAVVGIAHSNSENHTTANLNFENITVENCEINAVAKSSSAMAAGIAGYCYPANMRGISIDGLKLNADADGSNYTYLGGLSGYQCGQNISNNGNTRAYFTVENFDLKNIDIKAETDVVLAGAYCGYTYYGYITIENGNVKNIAADIDATEAIVGGLIGMVHRSDKGNTVTEVDVTGIDFDVTTAYLGETRVGGMVGYAEGPTVYTDCSVAGEITESCSDSANPVNYHAKVGGFVGRVYNYNHTFTNCTADVGITASHVAGGFVGNNNHNAVYTDCTATGDVTANIAGGFAGRLTKGTATFDGCSASGAVTGTNVAGGFIGSTIDHGWNAWVAGEGTPCAYAVTLTDCVASENVSTVNNTGYCAGVIGEAKLADGKELLLDNVTYTVEPAVYPTDTSVSTYVAEVNDVKYTSLQKAVDAADNGATITMIDDHQITTFVTIDKSITLDLNEKTITRESGTALYVNAADAVVTIEGDGTVESGSAEALYVNAGTVKVMNGTFRSTVDKGPAVYVINNGHAEIYGGTFSNNNGEFVLNEYDKTRDVTTITVYGGTFVGFNPENNAAEGAGTNFVAPGLYRATETGTGVYTVAEWNYEIHNKADLLFFQKLANTKNNSFSGKTIKLMADVNLEGMTWTPIKNFLGTFDGGDHTISNFHLDATKGHAGFFYQINFGNGTAIKNLTLSDITATVGNYYVGALAYFSFAVQDNITIKNFTVTTTASEAKVGGYAGWVEWGHIRNCTIENMVVNAENGAGLIGGLAAVLKADNWLQYNNIDVKGFKVTIHDTDNTYAEVGGLVGQTQTGHDAPVFTNCDITGIDVTASGLVTVGGFVARPGAHTTANNCTTEGKIDVTGVTSADESAGGFFGNLGWNNNESSRGGHKLTKCSANVDIITKIAPAGGFVGSATNEQNRNMAAAFTNCSALGDITVAEYGTANIGGFAGVADRGTYTNCTASGTVTNNGNGTGYAGQFVGELDEDAFNGSFKDCTYTGASTELKFIGNEANATIITSVAEVNGTKYTSLQAAINAAANGDVITLLADVTEDVTVVQAPDVAITIDGKNKEFNGTITVDGKSAAYETAGLTIKNINFDATDVADTCISLGVSGNNNTRYTSNVTVENCTFTGEGNAKAGIKNYTGGCKNLTIKDCTATGMHSLVQVKGIAGLTVSGGAINGKNGISVGTSTGVQISGVEITATGYGVRADGEGAYNMTVENCTISADLPVVVRKATGAYDLTVTGGALTAKNDKEYAVVFTNGDDGTFEVPTGSFKATIDEGIKSYPMSAYVAQVGENKYTSLKDALEACTNGETVKLIADITYGADDVVYAHGGATGFGNYDHYNPSIVYIGGTKGATEAENQPSEVNAVLDLNGHTITNNADAYLFLIMDNAKVTFTDSSEEQTGKVITKSTSYPAIWSCGTDTLVTIASGTYQTDSALGLIHATHSGDLVIEGGHFSTTADDASLLLMINSQKYNNPNYFLEGIATLTVKGGTFVGFNPEKIGDDYGASSIEDIKFVDGCALGYEAIENTDGTYGVQPWDRKIENKDDLLMFAAMANAGNNFSGETIELLADINLEGMTWTPIESFAGNFVGNNKTISNFHIDATASNAGFFNVIAGSNGLEDVKVKDLILSDVTATVGAYRFGTLANSVQGVVHNVTVKNVTVETTHTSAWVGGMCAFMSWPWMTNCTVENLVVDATAGADLIGGFSCILQKNANHVFDNLDVNGFKVTIHDEDDSGCGVGGFVAQTQRGWENPKVINSDITGINVVASGLVDVGGFIAWPGAHTIAENCTTQGMIDVTGVTSEDCFAGGFFGNLGWNADLGQMGHKVTDCTADVEIITKMADAGGFVGSATNSNDNSMYAEFYNCSASGDITAIAGGNADVGGFAGDADRGVYEGCSASGAVATNGTGYAGQFIGAFYEVTPKYDSRYPAGTRDYLVDESTAADCTYTGASTNLKFIGNTEEGADVEIVEYVAAIGDQGYASIEDAVEAAQPNDTIVLIEDIELTDEVLTISADKTVVIDLNGHTITGTVTEETTALVYVTGGCELTLLDSSEDKTGGIHAVNTNGLLSNLIRVETDAKLVIENGNYTQDASVNGAGMIDSRGDEIIIVKGGNFHLDNIGSASNGSPWIFNTSGQNTKNIIVIGGTYNADIFHQYYIFEVKDTTEVADLLGVPAKAAKDNGDGTWTIVDAVALVNEQHKSGNWYTQYTGYVTLQEAINAVKDTDSEMDEVVTLLTDGLSVEGVNKPVTIMKNGHTATIKTADGFKVVEDNDKYEVVAGYDPVAQIGEGEDAVQYKTLADAIKDGEGKTIVLLADITEDVTVNKNITIDGADKTYTGTMTVNAGLTVTIENVNFVNGGIDKSTKSTTGKYTVKNCTFDGAGTYAYAIRVKGINTLTVEDCTVKNYLYSFLYVTSGSNSVSVKNVTVEDCPSYAVYFASGVNNAMIENLTVKNSNNGFVIDNTANRTFTIKNCKLENVTNAISEANGTNTITCTVLGNENDFGTAATSQYAKYVLGDTDATLTAPEGATVTTNVADYRVIYADGKYQLEEIPYVAEVNDVQYESLQAAITAAQTGETVVLLSDIALTKADMVKTEDNRDVMLNIAGKDITLDLNEKIITVNYDDSTLLYTVVCVEDGAGLTVKNGTIDLIIGETKAGDYKCAAYMFWKRGTTGHLTIENGIFHANDLEDSMVYTNGNEIVTVKGGTFTLDKLDDENSPWIFNVQGQGDKHVIVTGGTYNADINRQKWCSEVLVPETYYTTDNGDGTWTVKEGAVAYVNTGMTTGPYFAPKNIGYATFEEAFTAAGTYNDHEITLLDDTDFEKAVAIDNLANTTVEGKTVYKLTINLNGYTAENLTAAKGVKMTKTDDQIVFEVDYVAQIGEGENAVQYTSVSDALAAAKSDDTVVLLKDAEESTVMIIKGVTLDLNGNTLTTGYVVAFGGNHIVDNSTAKTGLLKVEKSNLVLAKDNAQMPIWNGADGYVFATMKHQNKIENQTSNSISGKFRPSFGTAFNGYFADGAEDNGVEILIRLSWTKADGQPATQEFKYTTEQIADVYTNGKTFTFTVSGFEGFENFKVEYVVESCVGVQATAVFQ